MAHHSSEYPLGPRNDDADEIKREQLRQLLLNTTGFKGALGTFPEGQLTPNDEGAIAFGLAVLDGKVTIDFGTPVRSVGMTPQQACDLAGDLVKLARAAARKNGEMVALTIR